MLTMPAVISFLSKGIGLHSAFWLLACGYMTVEDSH